MLEFLKIENLALLDKASIDFHLGFSVMTGETGAGKSVLLGALSMLAGNRCGKEIIKSGKEFCSVEGILNFENSAQIAAFLKEEDLPPMEDGALVLRRLIHLTKSGKCFINGALVPSSCLQRLGELWIDFHGPCEPQKLFSAKNQLTILDAYADDKVSVASYLEAFSAHCANAKKIEELKSARQMSPDEIEFTRNQIAAIDALDISEESIASLESDFKLMERSREVLEKASAISDVISGDEGASDKLALALKLALEISSVGDEAKNLYQRLNEALIELSDIAEGFSDLSSSCNFSEEDAQNLRENMDVWMRLRRKYGASPSLVLAAKKEMQERIENQGDVANVIEKISAEQKNLEQKMDKFAEKIFAARKKTALNLSKKVEELLKRLGFKKPRFEIALEAVKEYSANCGSFCTYLFSANPGQALQELAKVASSGELARVMLAIKTASAEADETPVLVFDEVDANIGGETGIEVGKELLKLGKKHQVLCVTHLPQVAAFGQNHLLIEKMQSDTDTSVEIKTLAKTQKERTKELARMLGDRTSVSALSHAEELLGLAKI